MPPARVSSSNRSRTFCAVLIVGLAFSCTLRRLAQRASCPGIIDSSASTPAISPRTRVTMLAISCGADSSEAASESCDASSISSPCPSSDSSSSELDCSKSGGSSSSESVLVWWESSPKSSDASDVSSSGSDPPPFVAIGTTVWLLSASVCDCAGASPPAAVGVRFALGEPPSAPLESDPSSESDSGTPSSSPTTPS